MTTVSNGLWIGWRCSSSTLLLINYDYVHGRMVDLGDS
jgi:hypothetical protein